ncbi:MAG: 50S ribosomal protein L18 [Pseudomonadota bacterium]
MISKKQNRARRGKRTRLNMKELGTTRICVNRTSKHIYAQLISGETGCIVTSASTLDPSIRNQLKGIEGATKVGELLGQKAKDLGFTKVAFDRSGFKYHGQVKAVAEGARSAGLEF